jgi:transcriptional regulator with XRE-family HTH domain
MPRSTQITRPTIVDSLPSVSQALDVEIPLDRQRALTNLLVQQRTAMGKTQDQLSTEAHVDQTVISAIERKIPMRMGWYAFVRIIKAYGLDLNYVLQILGVVPEVDELQNPRITAIVAGLEDLDEDWQDYALSNIEVWLMGLRQRITAATKRSR